MMFAIDWDKMRENLAREGERCGINRQDDKNLK